MMSRPNDGIMSHYMTNQNNKSGSCVPIIAAIITALGVIAAALISQEKITGFFWENLATKTSSISAHIDQSGVSAGQDLLSFEKGENIAGWGDMDTGDVMKGFLTFHLGDIPAKAEISDAKLNIRCNVQGNPENFEEMLIMEYQYGTYEKEDFANAVENNAAGHIYYLNPKVVVDLCNKEGLFSISGNRLTQLIQERLSNEWVQFVIYGKGQTTLSNQSIDAVNFVGRPILVIHYHEIQ